MNRSSPSYRLPSAGRTLPALAAVAVVGAVVIASVAGGFGGDRDRDAKPPVSSPSPTPSVVPSSSSLPEVVVTESSEAPVTTTALSQPLGYGSAGQSVARLQERLSELGFFPGPADGQFGRLTEKAVWAYEKLVLQVPSDKVTGVVTNQIWRQMQGGIRIEPMRKHSKGQATKNHTEIYLPAQVVAWFVDDEPVLISHMSSGTGEEWREEVTIDPGEWGNENGTEPIVRGEIGVSYTPGGVFTYDRMIEGLRQSALGGLWNPAYFNYGIAIHGAINVPTVPASHGCVRVPQAVGEVFHEYVSLGDQVFVWDGVKEPEHYAQRPNAAYPQGQLPIFNRVDPDYTTTTTTSTSTTSTTVATTLPPTPPPTEPTVAPTEPPTTMTPPPPPTDPPTTTAATTSTTVVPEDEVPQ